jgi:cell division protein FtsZ
VASPLLEASIDGAHGVLLSVQGGSNLGIFEINDAARLVQEAVHPEANIIFGAVIDDTLGDEVRVTVIAAGFDGGEPVIKKQGHRSTYVDPDNEGESAISPVAAESNSNPAWEGEPELPKAPADPVFDEDDDNLDIPDFLK